MAQVREIKKRMKAVANIERITKTMQMIATARFQASVRRTEATKPYTEKLAEIVRELAAAAGEDATHPLLQPPEEPTGRELMLTLSSNRGLCGAYNANVLRRASNYVKERQDTEFELEVAGSKGLGYFRFMNLPVSRGHTQFTDKPTYEQVEELANDYIARFEAGQFDAVRVTYMRFISSSRQVPEVLQLLPLEPPRPEEQTGGGQGAAGQQSVYEFSPDPQSLLGSLLPMSVKSRLFQCFNDAAVSEQLSRMVAMKAATDNANKMGKQLRRDFNRARQAQITTELSDIIGGAAALS